MSGLNFQENSAVVMMPRHVEAGRRGDFAWFTSLLGALVVMNAVDGIMTLFWVLTGRATEANPIMGYLLSLHPVLFMCGKMFLVNVGAIVLWRLKTRRFALAGTIFCLSIYAAIVLYHWAAVWLA